jgi:hypothetical protein
MSFEDKAKDADQYIIKGKPVFNHLLPYMGFKQGRGY